MKVGKTIIKTPQIALFCVMSVVFCAVFIYFHYVNRNIVVKETPTSEKISNTPIKKYISVKLGINFSLPNEFWVYEGISTIDITNQPNNVSNTRFILAKDKTFIGIITDKDFSPGTNYSKGTFVVSQNLVKNIKNGTLLKLQGGENIKVIRPMSIGQYSGYYYKNVSSDKPSLNVTLVNDKKAVLVFAEYGNTEEVFSDRFMKFFEDFLKTLVIE